jgi:hypothetical protein
MARRTVAAAPAGISARDLKKLREEIRAELREEAEAERPDPAGDPGELEEADKLAEFQAEFGGREYKVRAERFNKEDSAWEIVGLFPLDGWDSYTILKPFGGGRYRTTLLNEKGKYVAGGRLELRIASTPAPAAVEPAKKPEDNPLAHPVVSMMIKQLEANQLQTTELLKTVLAKPAAEPAQKVPTPLEMIEVLGKLKTLTPGEESFSKKLNELVGMMDLMERLRGGDRGGSGGDGDGGGFLQMLKDGIAAAKELHQLRPAGGRPTAALPAAPAAPAAPAQPAIDAPIKVNLPGAAAEAAAQPAKESSNVPTPLIEGLKLHLDVVRQKAEAGADVSETADWLIDQLYDFAVPLVRQHLALAKFASDHGIVEQLVNRASDPEQLTQALAHAPELVKHRPWIEQVIASTAKKLAPEPAS